MSTRDTQPELERPTLQDDRLLRRRMSDALLLGDAEAGSSSMNRLGASSIAGVLVTVALVAVVGVFAILRPGSSTSWQEPGAFIVANETGTRYIYLGGVLSPVANYASAKLLLGNELHVVSASATALASAPQGPAVGIATAPDSLPDAAGMVGTDWSVCATGSSTTEQGLSASLHPGLSAAGEQLGADDAFLMRTEQGRTYLVRATHAHEIADSWLPALGYLPADALPVDTAFVAALPAGEPIAPPVITAVGQPGPALPGTGEPVPIGRIFADRGNAYYVMTKDGLASLTPMQADLLLADPRLSPAYAGGSPSPLPITAAQVTGSSVAPLPTSGGGAPAPAAAPTLTSWPAGEQQLCLRIPESRAPELVLGPAEATATATASPDGLLRLPTGRGALAAATPAPAGGVMPVYLITGSGVRYPIAGQQSLEQLGLAGVKIARVPTAVLDLLPTGPTLDAAAAALPVS